MRPIPESYWVEPDRFLAGEYPGSFDLNHACQKIETFVKSGFNTFIDLTRPHELIPYESILKDLAKIYGCDWSYHRFPIRDYDLPTRETMVTILDKIDASLSANCKVYLHCWGGVGRTGTVIGCYLVRRGFTGEQALAQLAEWWKEMPKRLHYPRSPETDEQVEFILKWK